MAKTKTWLFKQNLDLFDCFIFRQGVINPCRIGADGRPVPVGHIMELQEELGRQQVGGAETEDAD